MATNAILMVTRNRQQDLAATLDSVAEQQTSAELHLVLVDASDPGMAEETRRIADSFRGGEVSYYRFEESPSAARQRNFGLDRLPEPAEIVFFMDDDVKLHPGFLQALAGALDQEPLLGAVGGIKMMPQGGQEITPYSAMWLRRLFLIDHPSPGRLLVSGYTSPASSRPITGRTRVEWLTSCGMAVRREVADRFRFDPRLDGYALHGDLDFTYRISREWEIAVDPAARLVHYKSPKNRMAREVYARKLLLHQYWIVEKNIRHPLKKAAFWWATLGRMAALSLSRHPNARDVRRGLLRAIPAIFRRDYYLLNNTGSS